MKLCVSLSLCISVCVLISLSVTLCVYVQNNNRDILSSIYFRLDYHLPEQDRPTMSAGQPLIDLNQFPVINPYSLRPQLAVR